MNINPTVGQNISLLREEQGKTLEEIAALSGVDTGNLSRIERGIQGYTDATLRALAAALDVEPADLLRENAVYRGRAARVRWVIDGQFGGVASKFAHAIGRSPNQVSRWFTDNPQNARCIGEKIARDIERKLGLEANWLDGGAAEGARAPLGQSPQITIESERLAFLRMEALKLAHEVRLVQTHQTGNAFGTKDYTADDVVADAKKFMAMVLEG